MNSGEAFFSHTIIEQLPVNDVHKVFPTHVPQVGTVEGKSEKCGDHENKIKNEILRSLLIASVGLGYITLNTGY